MQVDGRRLGIFRANAREQRSHNIGQIVVEELADPVEALRGGHYMTR